jgi:hypothetical protein
VLASPPVASGAASAHSCAELRDRCGRRVSGPLLTLFCKWSPQPAFPQTLLQIARAGPDENVRMSAAAYFKNLVGNVWLEKASQPGQFLLSEETKEACRALLVPAAIESSAQVRKMLAEAMKVRFLLLCSCFSLTSCFCTLIF